MICPKCQHEQAESEACNHCGIIFQKYFEYLERVESEKRAPFSKENDQELEKDDDGISKLPNWKPVSTPACIFLSALFLAHIIYFPKEPVLKDWAFLSSFVHSVNLVFHEAGHVLFAIFGNQTLTILGGSLNQLLIPLIVLITFFYKRDTAGAVFALFWFFGNFLDVGIYMADARFLKLPLIGGLGMETHDWRNLFNRFDLWSVDQLLSHITFYSGWLGIIISEVWLIKRWRNSTRHLTHE
jgi:hypothetical protein